MDRIKEVRELEESAVERERMRTAMEFVQQLPSNFSTMPVPNSRPHAEFIMQNLQASPITQPSVLRYAPPPQQAASCTACQCVHVWTSGPCQAFTKSMS